MMTEIISLNGNLLPANTASIAIDDRGFLLGDGLFETIRFDQNHAPHFLQHWTRLQNGCDILGIHYSASADTTYHHISELLSKNHLECKSASIRITLTRGSGPRGLMPPKTLSATVLIRCFEVPKKKPASISVMHSNVIINEHSPLRQFKSLNYIENILAQQQARHAGYNDALLYNTQGCLVGTTCANVFLMIDDKVITPSLASGTLPGIMRQHILEISRQHGFSIHETTLRRAECDRAQAALITNSIVRVTPIHQLGNQQLMDSSNPDNLLNTIKDRFS